MNKKEVETISGKFHDQMDDMDRHIEKDIDREVRTIITRVGPGKEEALIVVNEAYDDLLERKLKILMSKQFSDLTMYLGSMNKKAATEQMIRDRKIELRFKQMKEIALREQIPESELAEKLQVIEAEKDLELQLSNQKGNHDREEREQMLRENLEDGFFNEKKDLLARTANLRRLKIKQVMARMPDNETVQEVGEKLLRRIDMTVEDEIAEAEKDMEANLEKTRMKVIAENEKQLQDMKANLNEAMRREEKKLEEQMAQRKEQILTIKRQNLEERLKMAGEMTQEQIKELRLQYEREYNNLEKVIAEEKAK